MKMRSSGSNSGPKEPVPQGVHLGILYSILELGTQDVEYQGQQKKLYKVSLTWELPNEHREFTDRDGKVESKPLVISKDYTLSSNEKSTLRLMIEGWRGKIFTDAEAEAFDITTLIGKPCLVNVAHVERNGNTYSNIASITNVMKGMEIPELTNKPRLLEFDKFDWSLYESLPEFLRTKIASSPEFASLVGPKVGPAKPTTQPSNQTSTKPTTWTQAAAATSGKRVVTAPPVIDLRKEGHIPDQEVEDDLPF